MLFFYIESMGETFWLKQCLLENDQTIVYTIVDEKYD